MEALSFQQLLEQPPRLQLYEHSPLRQMERNTVASPPHKWTAKQLRKLAADTRDILTSMDTSVQWLEYSAAVFNGIGKYGLDEMFSEYTEDILENSWRATEYYYRQASASADNLKQWEEGYSIFISKLNERDDIPKQVLRRLNASLAKFQQIRSRVEQSWTDIKGYKTPVFSSILLSLAKFRELTIEEKKVILTSAVFHGPIDNPPSDYREDWYDDHGR